MSSGPRVVIDTNVLVSAALVKQGLPRQAVDLAGTQGQVLLSSEAAKELSIVLGQEKFNRYLTKEERESFLQKFVHKTTLIEITEQIRQCRDPTDDKFLELAVSGGASSIITGDKDLLTLHPFRSIQILTPKDFLAWLATGLGEKES